MNQPKPDEVPRDLAREEQEFVVDSVRREHQEVEKILKRKKELILREEEEELQHPWSEVSALDRLSQRNEFQLSLSEPARVPRFATKDWEKPAAIEDHKKIVLAWCLGSALFASLLGLIAVTWRCCRKKREEDPSPCEFVRGFIALLCRTKKREPSISAVEDARDSIELEPLK